ncbi:hypothetical protein SDJN03_08063, partial [Cucurbita argyrosperma subsp. sororia]
MFSLTHLGMATGATTQPTALLPSSLSQTTSSASLFLWMYLVVIQEEDWLVNWPDSFLGILRPPCLSVERKAFSHCVSRDRWDKEFFKLQSG